MLNAYGVHQGVLRKLQCSGDNLALIDASWIDLVDPTREEELAVEAMLGLEIPSREEMRSIEASSAAYHANGAAVMNARVVGRTATAALQLIDVTFIMKDSVLTTLRYGDPLPFRTFVARAEKTADKIVSGEAVMVGLLEAIVDRAAEIHATVGDELEALSSDIFLNDGSATSSGNRADLRPVLQKIGRNGDLASRVRESLHTISRVVPFLAAGGLGQASGDLPARLATVSRDIVALLDHNGHLASKATFLLDATLGFINIQQNNIINILSVASVIFLPPTLISSLYGMNFKDIPELSWAYGYPYALALMAATAILPYWFFKRRGWL